MPSCGRPAANDPATLLHPIIDPAKLATLGVRGANQRIQKATAILWQAKVEGDDPVKVAERAVKLKGTEKGKLTAAALARNVTILERLGSTTPEDLASRKLHVALRMYQDSWTQPKSLSHELTGQMKPWQSGLESYARSE